MSKTSRKRRNKRSMQYIKTINAPTYLEMAEVFDMKIGDVDKAIKQLVDAGYIKVDGDVIHMYAPIGQKI